jgi:aminoglycoside phosphotransferase (APT) family kinase protein
MPPWTGALAAFIAARLPSADTVTVVPAGPLPAGASNATIAFDAHITCDGHESVVHMILRPQRGDGILAPYDVARQFQVMRALNATDVPVPAVAWLEATGDVLGVPFFVMGRLPGVRTPPLFWYGAGPMVDAAAGALARIHRVDWESAGLANLRPGDAATPLASELKMWDARARHVGTDRDQALARLRAALIEHEPADARFALTHGDTNAGNYLFRANAVAAVVDWELAAIGDPRSDLGFYAALEAMFGASWGSAGDSVLAEAYARVTGDPLEHLGYYEAWGYYRMLVIFAGRGGWWHPFGATSLLARVDELLPGWR